jgi:hypothetical protein
MLQYKQSPTFNIFYRRHVKKRIKINKIKATFTGRSPRHTQAWQPEDTQQKPGVDIRAAKDNIN